MIIGNQQNEGTVFSLFQSNITTKAALVLYLNDVFFHNATRAEIVGLVDTYPKKPHSPVGIGASNETYPEFKRLAAILGDYEFAFMVRLLLETFPATVPARSYEAAYGSGTPILRTYHSSELPHLYCETDGVSTSIQDLYISFVDCLDPNNYAANTPSRYLTHWPTWQEKRQLLEPGPQYTRLIGGNARAVSYEYVRTHLKVLRV